MRNMRAAQDVSSLMVSTSDRMLRRHSDINASDVAAVATRCVLTRFRVKTEHVQGNLHCTEKV